MPGRRVENHQRRIHNAPSAPITTKAARQRNPSAKGTITSGAIIAPVAAPLVKKPLANPRSSGGALFIGKGGFFGEMDDVRVYSRAFSRKEVKLLRAAGEEGKSPELATKRGHH